MHQTRWFRLMLEIGEDNLADYFIRQSLSYNHRVMVPIYISTSNMKYRNIQQRCVNSSRLNPRLKVTHKLELLEWRDNSSPQEIIPRKGAPKYQVPTDTFIRPKQQLRYASKLRVPKKLKIGSGIWEV